MVAVEVEFKNNEGKSVGMTGGALEYHGRSDSLKDRLQAQINGYANKARGMLRRGYFEDAASFTVRARVFVVGTDEELTGERTFNCWRSDR